MRIFGRMSAGRGWGRKLLAAGAAGSALLAIACSSSSSGSGASPAATATPAAVGASGPAEPSSVTHGVPSLIASMPASVTGIDPMQTIFTQNVWALHLVGGTLFAFVPGQNSETVPALAASGSLSANGLTATVKLKPGLKFSDGSPLTSADVVGTFRRDLSMTKAPGASFFANIASVSAPDPSTVVIHFKSPDPQYRVDLSLFPFTIVPNGSWTKPNFATSLVSAGPYVVQGKLTGNQLVLTRNPDYAGPKPAVAKLTFDVIADPSAALNELQTGQIDFDSTLPPANATTLPKSLTVGKVEPWLITMFTFNQSNSLLSNVRIRQAIGYALDRTQLNAVGQSDQGEPWASEFSPNFSLSQKEFPPPFPATADLAKARQLLKGTACASGCSFSVNVESGTPSANYATIAQQELAQIGIQLQVVPLDPNTYNQRNFAGQYQSLIVSGGAFSGSTALNLTLNPDGPTGAMFSHYTSPQMVSAIQAANSALGTSGQTAAFQKLAQLYDEDIPWVPISTAPFIWASDSKAAGNLFFSPTGLPDVSSLG